MSPLAHGLIAWIVAVLILRQTRDRRLAIISGVFSDIDGFFILYDRTLYYQYHHTLGHSYVAALPLVLLATYLAVDRKRTFAASLTAFTLHLVSDIVGSDWPVQPLYPLSTLEVPAEQLFSNYFIYQVINPAALILAILIATAIVFFKESTPLEFLSLKLDHRAVGLIVCPFRYGCRICGKRAFFICDECGEKSCLEHTEGRGVFNLVCSTCEEDNGISGAE